MKTIVLTPWFNDVGEFDGYNQVSGTHCFDSIGHLYTFVSIEDYNKLVDKLAEAEEDAWKYRELNK